MPLYSASGGGGAESARADLNFRELPRHLSNTYQKWPILLKLIGEQDSGKILRHGYYMSPVFDAMFTRVDFLNIILH